MGETPMAGLIDFEDLPRSEMFDVAADGDFPLAHSLRRRKRELDRPEPVIAGHDSVI